ncbi:putative retrotransposon protein [Panicum miliaceum]|uniref:Retrotransposon protein n=1 Tax=Panicum miliaceum TaxID=4540 RepID=A0A3L6PQ44_PANMI|nr:putative retrotransposon protein [Panicum miliaceum]
MARVKETAKLVEGEKASSAVEDQIQNLGDEEDLSQVDADLSDLMGRLLQGRGVPPPGDEDTPNPLEGETIVFRDFFTAGLRFPLDPSFPEILARYNVKMHHLTANAIIQLSKFFWAVRTFCGPVSSDTFCRFYELHPQGRKISFEGEDEFYNAQSGCCTFVPRRNNKVLKLDRVEISYS